MESCDEGLLQKIFGESSKSVSGIGKIMTQCLGNKVYNLWVKVVSL